MSNEERVFKKEGGLDTVVTQKSNKIKTKYHLLDQCKNYFDGVGEKPYWNNELRKENGDKKQRQFLKYLSDQNERKR